MFMFLSECMFLLIEFARTLFLPAQPWMETVCWDGGRDRKLDLIYELLRGWSLHGTTVNLQTPEGEIKTSKDTNKH